MQQRAALRLLHQMKHRAWTTWRMPNPDPNPNPNPDPNPNIELGLLGGRLTLTLTLTLTSNLDYLEDVVC